jgi:TRAP-type mannitol/chloroaromatic compound transport system permease small subunit
MRYLFHEGSVALQELEWHLFAIIFLLGAAYTLRHDDHVRVDVFYRSHKLTPRHRAFIDLLGTVLFMLPFCWLVIDHSLPIVASAYHMGEGSPDPGGLPYRFLLKAAIPVGFALLMLQGVALVIRSLQVIYRPPVAAGHTE